MNEVRRYGIFAIPDGPLFAAASAWLGWDSARGQAVARPVLAGLPDPDGALTDSPRRYGFHGTIKPPFALADGHDADGLHEALRRFCSDRRPITVPALAVRRFGGFVAMVPVAPAAPLGAEPLPRADPADLVDLAAGTVRALDRFRAPPSGSELDRRRRAGLTARQETLLKSWGYPHVMEEFRFHMTLTGRTNRAERVAGLLAQHFAPVLQEPLVIASLALVGEDAAGRFHLIRRVPLAG